MANIFMHIKGYKGNVTDGNYKDWIALHNVEFGGNRAIKMSIGEVVDRQHSRLTLHKMTLIKQLDDASNDLFSAMCRSTTFSQVEIHVCQNETNLQPQVKFILEGAMVATHHTDIAGGAAPIEEVELAYTKLQRTTVKYDANNKAQAPRTTGYDLEQAKPL